MRAAVIGQRQLQHVLEIIRQHGMTPAVCKAVGIKRHHDAAGDGENAKARPGEQERQQAVPGRHAGLVLHARERVDDAAEQHRFGELRCRQRNVCDSEEPAEPGLRPEQLEDAHIKAGEIHRGSIR